MEAAVIGWREAFLIQSYSDYCAFKHLHSTEHNLPLCHTYHYLQMATEKLARGFSSPHNNNAIEPRRTHAGFLQFIRLAGQQGRQFDALYAQLPLTRSSLKAYFKGFEPMARELEILAPALSSGINTEYPWKGATSIEIPAEYMKWDSAINPVRVIKLAELLEAFYRSEGLMGSRNTG